MTQPNTSDTDFSHTSVLLNETVSAVTSENTDTEEESKLYVDATFGRGGHSRLLLQQMKNNDKLFVFDKDPEAIATAKKLAKSDERITVIHDSFANIQSALQDLGIKKIHGLMADLGVSSPQLDDASRGFSFMHDGAVDMRMNNNAGMTAGEWLAMVDEETLANVLYEYGDERYSRRIAKAIKAMDSYTSTLELAETIKTAHPKWEKNKHPATKSFQAIRIHINDELTDVDKLLEQSVQLLHTNGVLAVISFHSLEDRRVKQFLQKHSKGSHPGDENLPLPPERPRYFAKPNRVKASDTEIKNNPRARSAWLRYALRTSE